MSRVYFDLVRLGPTAVTSDGLPTLIGSIPISRIMAGITSGNYLSLAAITVTSWFFNGVDNPLVHYKKIVTDFAIGLDTSTYIISPDVLTRTDFQQTETTGETIRGGEISQDISGGNLRIYGEHGNEIAPLLTRVVCRVEIVRAFDI